MQFHGVSVKFSCCAHVEFYGKSSMKIPWNEFYGMFSMEFHGG